MAEMKDPRGKRPTPRKQDPLFSNSPDVDMGGGECIPAVLRRPAAKAKKSWFQQNQLLVIGVAAGVGVLMVVLVLGFALGMFGTGGGAKPNAAPSPTPVATQPVAPPPAAPSSQPTAPQPTPTQPAPGQPATTQATPPAQGGGFTAGKSAPSGQAASPGKAPSPDAKKGEPKKKPKPSVPNEVAKWKPADYKCARHDNHPKLLDAIVRLGEKYPGNEKAAQCLVDLLKPLPAEKPPAAASPSETPAAPSSPQQPPPRGRAPPPRFAGGPPQTPPPNNPAANSDDVGPRPYTPADLTKLVETIVEALGCNSSGLACSTLERVLAGTFTTDDDKTAVEATLKTLLAHPSEEGDALLFRVVTAAKDLRSAEHEGPWPAKDLQTHAFELAKQLASIGLRTKLAGVVLSKHMRLDPQDPTTEFLLLANPLNCGAQLLFYEKADLKKNKELKTALEQQFVGYSSAAVAHCLGIPSENLPGGPGVPAPQIRPAGGFRAPPGRPGGGKGGFGAGGGGFGGGAAPTPIGGAILPPAEPLKATDADLGPQIAAQLWSDEFRKLIEPQVGDLHSLEKQPQLTVLAATIPEDSTRAILAKLLRKHWSDGPKALETAGLLDRAITDPGLLPIIKMSGKRKESDSTPRVADVASRHGRGPGPGSPGGGGRIEAAQKQFQAQKDWMDVSAKLAAGWCKRLGAAAPTKDVSDTPDKSAGDAGELKLPSGFELPSTAKVVASHRVVLPGATPDSVSQVQPSTLELYYVLRRGVGQAEKSDRVL